MFGCASDILNYAHKTNSHDQIDGRLIFFIVILRFRGFWEAQYSCSNEIEALHQNLAFMTRTFFDYVLYLVT
jgi:hypothetical protein